MNVTVLQGTNNDIVITNKKVDKVWQHDVVGTET